MMLKAKRQRGRPRKKEDAIESWQFGRAGISMCAYDEARRSGEKHSVAVKHAVQAVKQDSGQMRMSETEVRRILAKWRPRGSRTILRFKRSALSEEDVKVNRWIRDQLAMFKGKKGLALPEVPNYDQLRSIAVFAVSLARRPNYPRHNRKSKQE